MMIKIAGCLLIAALFASCETTATTRTTTTTTASRQTLADRVLAKRVASNSPALPESSNAEPAAPAEGPDDVATSDPEAKDPNRNPALVPSPMLRYWASSRTP